jgi:hypothetical protein
MILIERAMHYQKKNVFLETIFIIIVNQGKP